MFGRAPRTSFSVLADSSAGEWNCDVLDDDQIKRALKGVLELQEQFHVQVQERVAAERERRRKESSAGLELPNFEVGDYVLYARVRRPGVTPKVMATWTGPWAGGWCSPSHLFEIQNIESLILVAFTRRMLLVCGPTPIRSSTSPQMSRMCFSTRSIRGNLRWLVLSPWRKQIVR